MTLYHDDVVTWLTVRQWLVENGYLPKYHAVFADPPYFLGSITKRFGKDGAAPAQYGRDGAFQRQSRGFMGQTWDGFEDIYHYEAWITSWAKLMLSFIHPGGLLVMSGGTRTYHRLATGLENAGWEIDDSIICWMYGSGFPKNHSVSNDYRRARRGWAGKTISNELMGSVTLNKRLYWRRLERRWEGYGTALKPSYEPYVIARAPRGNDTYADLARRFSSGLFNLDGGRIGEIERTYSGMKSWNVKLDNHAKGDTGIGMADGRGSNLSFTVEGRYPANTLFACECRGQHKPGCPVAILDQQSGQLTSGTGAVKKASAAGYQAAAYGKESRPEGTPNVEYGDTGSAARFFYQAKASAWEREAGLVDFQQQIVNDGRVTPIDNPYQRGETKRRNIHPTVKPIQLCEYIARLLLPPKGDEPRRLLIPFAGVGSEMIGAALAGWDEIDGIELTADYIPINETRRRWWAQYKTYAQAQRAAGYSPAEITTQPEQLNIFDYLNQG